MGTCRLVARLALRDTLRHGAQALLLVLVIATSTTVLALGLALNGVTVHPYEQTKAATKGPDVVAYLPVMHQPGEQSQPPGLATALMHARGVTGASGPYPMAAAVIRVNGLTAGVEAEGRSESSAAVDQPKVTAGSWVRPGGVVIERTFAEALNVGVGARVTLNGLPYKVDGDRGHSRPSALSEPLLLQRRWLFRLVQWDRGEGYRSHLDGRARPRPAHLGR